MTTTSETSDGTRREVSGWLATALLGPDGEQTPLQVRMYWCSDDPWAVTVTFGTGRDATRWLMGLELLVAGCVGPAGLGDVSLLPALNVTDGRPETGAVELVVSSPTGQASVRLLLVDLDEVLGRIVCARDLAECTLPAVDVDAELGRLLVEGQAAGGEDR